MSSDIANKKAAVAKAKIRLPEQTTVEQLRDELRHLRHNVEERVKELSALHRTVRLLQDSEKPSELVLREIVGLLPPAWQYPAITAARIVYDDMEFHTSNWKKTPWIQQADVITADGKRGAIEVAYLENRPQESEGPFLEEERSLINSLAESVSSYLDRKRTEVSLQRAHQRLQALSRQLLQVQEQERRRISRDLHDEVGQALTAVKMNLHAVEREKGTSRTATSLRESMAIVEEVLQVVRNLSLDLRPSLLDDLGLVSAVRWYVTRHAERAGLACRIVANESLHDLPQDERVACFRVIQEAVTNILRHAQATRLTITLGRKRGAVEVLIQDNGLGFEVPKALDQASRGQSVGLLGMQERVHLLGGTIEIQSTSKVGTSIHLHIPISSSRPPILDGQASWP